MVIPAVLVSLGVALSQLKITNGWRNLALAARGLPWPPHRNGLCLGVWDGGWPPKSYLADLMPIAVLNYMFAAMYDNQVEKQRRW